MASRDRSSSTPWVPVAMPIGFSPCLVCRKDVALLEIRVASKALGQAEGAAEELDPPGQNHRAKDAEVDATRLLVRPTYCGLHLCQWRRE